MLTNTELDIIDKVTSIMKTDWLFIDGNGNGNFKDLDNKGRVMSKRKAIKQVVETAPVVETQKIGIILNVPDKAVTLTDFVTLLLEQLDSVTRFKLCRPLINAYLRVYITGYDYKDVLKAFKSVISSRCDNRYRNALQELTYNNVLKAVAPLVFNTDAYKQIATDAVKSGALDISDPVQFCRAYFSAVDIDGNLLTSARYITEDGQYITSKYVIKPLTEKIAVSVFMQSLSNFDRVSRKSYGVGHSLNNTRSVGALTGKVYTAKTDDNGKYITGDVVDVKVKPSDFTRLLSDVNRELTA